MMVVAISSEGQHMFVCDDASRCWGCEGAGRARQHGAQAAINGRARRPSVERG